MARRERLRRPLDRARIPRVAAVEAARLAARVGVRVADGHDAESERNVRDAVHRDLPRVAAQIRHTIRHAPERRRRARLDRRRASRRRHDARRRDEHRPIALRRQRESLRAGEIEIDRARLVEVERIHAVDRDVVVLDRVRPAERRAPRRVGAELAVDQRDVRRGIGEHGRAAGARRRNARRIGHVATANSGSARPVPCTRVARCSRAAPSCRSRRRAATTEGSCGTRRPRRESGIPPR